VRSAIFGFLLLTTLACSPAQRASAGIGIGVAGMGVTYGALVSMMPSCRVKRAVDHVCVEYTDPLPPKVAFPIAFGGLCAVVLGGVLLATASEPGEQPPMEVPTQPALPDTSTVLDKTNAVGMAIAQLVLVGFDGEGKESNLLGVDDTQASVRAKGRRAELWNLRIRSAADEAWRSVGACYEYEHEWQLKSLTTTPGCR